MFFIELQVIIIRNRGLSLHDNGAILVVEAIYDR